MDGLLVKDIPQVLLARILVQLYIIPQQVIKSPHFNLLSVLVAGLRDYGQGKDLDAFFTFCTRQSLDCLAASGDDTSLTNTTWHWKDHALHQISDWDLIDREQLDGSDAPTELMGLRLQIATEKVRAQIELVRYGKKLAALHDDRLTCTYEGQHISLEDILTQALDYMAIQQEGITELSSLKSKTTELLKKRLEQLAKDRQEYEQAHSSRSESDFVLMGALMVKLDGTHINDTTQNGWYLYLRDYMVDDIGSTWRVIKGTSAHDDVEIRISSHQVLADLRGTNIKNDDGLECHPSPTSNDFRPVYLFYCNNDIVSRSAKDMMIDTGEPSDNQATENNESSITLADYAFGDDDGDNNLQYDEDKWDMDLCKYCGIGESIDNVNTIFFCDECNLGVHQLCEQPTIGAFEMDIDPWYCRDCSRSKGLPMPIPPPYLSSTNELQNSDTSMKKRKWDE